MKKKLIYWGLGICLFTFLGLEIGLRMILGLGDPVLSQKDKWTGYRFQPNQSLTRLGHSIEYNQYSQRSEALSKSSPEKVLRVLMIGDSVLNGGSRIDQAETISEQFEKQIVEKKSSKDNETVEVLNASAGSWGIGNQWGYLQQFGTFNSDLLILQIGTHDLVQPTSKGDRVGLDPNYPNHKPLLALQELVTRYLLPKLNIYLYEEIPSSTTPETQFQENLELLEAILHYAQAQKIPVYVLYTPNRVDLLPTPQQPPYKKEFQRFLESQDVVLIDSHAAWSALPPETVSSYFRDSVHLNEKGNNAIAKLLFKTLNPRL